MREGYRWASLLNLTTPATVAPYDYVMVMLDDIALTPEFDVRRFVDEAARHNLSRASPSVFGAAWGSSVFPWQSLGSKFEDNVNAIRSCRAHGGHCGVRLVSWTESFLTLYTRAAWECYWSMFADAALGLGNERGAIGFGYDRCFKLHCGARHRRQGTLLDFAALHTERKSGGGSYMFVPSWITDGVTDGFSSTGEKAHGRRLSLIELTREANGQVARLEQWVRAQHGLGPRAKCEDRLYACNDRTEEAFCPIERDDLSVSFEHTYRECWHSCCCYDAAASRPVAWAEWTRRPGKPVPKQG